MQIGNDKAAHDESKMPDKWALWVRTHSGKLDSSKNCAVPRWKGATDSRSRFRVNAFGPDHIACRASFETRGAAALLNMRVSDLILRSTRQRASRRMKPR